MLVLLLLILSAHFLADFTLQPNSWARKKYTDVRYLFRHVGVYTIILGIIFILCVSLSSAIKACILIALSHLIIDSVKIYCCNKYSESSLVQFSAFCLDQLAHITIIGIGFHFFHLSSNLTHNFGMLCLYYPTEKFAHYLLLVILLLDPSSVFVKKLIEYISSDNETDIHDSDTPPAGSLIGKLERLIIAMLVIYNEVGAIGFVLAAKSFARYKQFKNQKFTEKFLVGTLSSTAMAMILTFLLR